VTRHAGPAPAPTATQPCDRGSRVFPKAIVATDLGPSSEAIVACAGSLGTLGVTRVTLVHVISLDHVPSPEDDAAFSAQVSSLEDAGIAVTVETPMGYAPHAITDLAEAHGADLIVMGTRGHGLFHTGFSGSVSSDVIRLSTVPVLLAPHAAADSRERGADLCGRILSSVLVPTDFTPAAANALDLACRIGRTGAGRLTITHVIEATFEALRGGRESRATEHLEILSERARDVGVGDVRNMLVLGDPGRTIVEMTRSGEYTLVVLAPRCLDTVDQQFGSVTNAVIKESGIPMLLLPPLCDRDLYTRGNT